MQQANRLQSGGVTHCQSCPRLGCSRRPAGRCLPVVSRYDKQCLAVSGECGVVLHLPQQAAVLQAAAQHHCTSASGTLLACLLLLHLLCAAHVCCPPCTRSPQVQQLLSSYTDICHAAAAGSADTSDEFLYGRAGTLFGALLLRQQLGEAAVPDAAVGQLVASILASGARQQQQQAVRIAQLVQQAPSVFMPMLVRELAAPPHPAASSGA